MKSVSTLHPRRGVALIIVLAMLLLLSSLLVAFMSSVSVERQAARANAATFEARQAYESAVNLVISQIREATRQDNKGWASQPGAIRTFAYGENNKEEKDSVYKLYSSDKMIMSDKGTYKPESFEESGFDPADPQRTEPQFVNLNKPLLIPVEGDKTGKVNAYYPIFDPMAVLNYSSNPAGTDPSAPGKGSIEGFYCANIPNKAPLVDGLGRTVRDLPMRVKWLYQLRDGTIAAADGNGVIAGAKRENPPVARFAFWTDDETCKLNLNTAAEATFADTPMATTIQEAGKVDSAGEVDSTSFTNNGPVNFNSLYLASSQPAQYEFQRYPGHPATTNLSPALRWLFPAAASNDARDKVYKEALYRLLPRTSGGYSTSVAGTKNPYIVFFNPYGGTKKNVPDPRKVKRDRLFATVDDFWFRPDRTPITNPGTPTVFLSENSALPTRDTAINMPESRFGKTPATTIERLRSFLTVNSRSSDLNLFGMPRISIWPMPEKVDRRSGFDDLANFCSTVAGKSYSFARDQSWSATYDLEEAGTKTGAGGVTSRDPGRNKALFEYLQRLTSTKMPGTNGTFVGKYGGDRDQILIEIFDYIRSTNLVDTSDSTGVGTISATSSYPNAYTPGYDHLPEGDPNKYNRAGKSFIGSGQVMPIIRKVGGTVTNRGMGRFLTVTEVSLAFFVDRDRASMPHDDPGQKPADPIPNPNPERGIRCILLVEMGSVSPGYPAMSESYAYTVEEKSPFTFEDDATGVSHEFKMADRQPGELPDANFVEVDAWRGTDGRFFMNTRGFANQLQFDSAPAGTLSNKVPSDMNPINRGDYARYPFISRRYFYRPLTTSPSTPRTEFKFKGGELEIGLYTFPIQRSSTPGFHPTIPGSAEPMQKISVRFPSDPITVLMPPIQGGDAPELTWNNVISGEGLLRAGDSSRFGNYAMRSMELNGTIKGDLRLAMGRPIVPSTYFSPVGSPAEYNSKVLQVQNLRTSWGRRYANSDQYGSINPGTRVNRGDKIADMPKSVIGAPSLAGAVVGDYDRGFSKHLDGAFINKPDEGNVRMDLNDDPNGGGALPYFRGAGGYDEVGSNFFSPNRIMPSPVMFGSLPTGVMAGRPWETLLFCPPVGSHKGAASPADHYLLDLFTMPVVEPYAISEPLSTDGRINLNHKLAPFGYVKGTNGRGYIERTTGLHGVLKEVKQFAMPAGIAELAHGESPLTNGNSYDKKFRFNIDSFDTIDRVITPFLDTNGYYKSATQICEVDLLTRQIPTSINATGAVEFGVPTAAGRASYWNSKALTGDNMRERPYAHIYPRLTTRSNTYTVHVWAQGIAKNPATKEEDWDKFDETKDRVIGEYRGSTTIERYLDPYDPAIKNYDATKGDAVSLDKYYRFRLLNHRRFTAS